MKALQLDDELAEAHKAYGTTVFWLDRSWPEAEAHYDRALELNQSTPDAHFFYAICYRTPDATTKRSLKLHVPSSPKPSIDPHLYDAD